MKTILVNRKPIIGPWGGGNNFVTAFYEGAERNNFNIVNQFSTKVDAMLIVDPRYDELGISMNEALAFKKTFKSTKLIYRVNECDARKGEINTIDPLVREIDKHADLSIFISEWLLNYHRQNTNNNGIFAILYNGVNTNIFNEKKKIANDTINIVTHHWSNNAMKGYDIYKQVDDWLVYHPEFTFTYIGRSHGNFKNTKIIPPCSGLELANLLGSYDVYISGSRFDPGPNHISESLACNLPTYAHSHGGGAAEMVGKSHVYENINELLKILESKKFEKNKDAIKIVNWSDCVDNYYALIRATF